MILTIKGFLDQHFNQYVEDLREWLRIPSISTLPETAEDVEKAAEWIQTKLLSIGFSQVETIPTTRHPLVYTEWLERPDQPTILIYGHYDVQPVDPLSEWLSDPFEPIIQDGNIYGRGACDDKAQILLCVAALEAYFQVDGQLPVNIKILLEGEEESGGESIDAFVRENGVKLQADAALICDTHMLGAQQPSLVNGLRGLVYCEVLVSGACTDLHSGTYGGVAPNPIHALCLLMSSLKGRDGRINISEIQESIPLPDESEKKFWDNDPLNLNSALLQEMGVEQLQGESSFPPLERLGIRPTLEIHGIRGGFTGEGAKTVIPSEALAKISLRLPAGVKPESAFTWFEKAVMASTPPGYRVEVRYLSGGEGISVSPDNHYIHAAADALKAVYGKEVVFMREGGSIPVAALFDKILQVPVVLMGFGLPDDGPHAPNEKFSLDQYAKGMHTVAEYLRLLQKP